jgi:hypothetical protein
MDFDNDIPEGGILEVIFPPDHYVSGLGLEDNFGCTIDSGEPLTCTVEGNLIWVPIGPYIAGGDIILEINGIQNPSKIGGTGSFGMRTFIGINVIDINLNFGTVGISRTPIGLSGASVILDVELSTQAGEIGGYIFTMTPNNEIPGFSRIRITFPDDVSIRHITGNDCTTLAADDFELVGTLTCMPQPPRIVDIVGFTNAIPAG